MHSAPLAAGVSHDKAGVQFFDRPRRREATNHHLPSSSHKIKTITIKIPIWSMVFMS